MAEKGVMVHRDASLTSELLARAQHNQVLDSDHITEIIQLEDGSKLTRLKINRPWRGWVTLTDATVAKFEPSGLPPGTLVIERALAALGPLVRDEKVLELSLYTHDEENLGLVFKSLRAFKHPETYKDVVSRLAHIAGAGEQREGEEYVDAIQAGTAMLCLVEHGLGWEPQFVPRTKTHAKPQCVALVLGYAGADVLGLKALLKVAFKDVVCDALLVGGSHIPELRAKQLEKVADQIQIAGLAGLPVVVYMSSKAGYLWYMWLLAHLDAEDRARIKGCVYDSCPGCDQMGEFVEGTSHAIRMALTATLGPAHTDVTERALGRCRELMGGEVYEKAVMKEYAPMNDREETEPPGLHRLVIYSPNDKVADEASVEAFAEAMRAKSASIETLKCAKAGHCDAIKYHARDVTSKVAALCKKL